MMPKKHEPKGPSRAEVEGLCVLHALGDGGCDGATLTARLGLPSHLADAVAEAAAALQSGAWVKVEGATLTRTPEGTRHLAERLAIWEVP